MMAPVDRSPEGSYDSDLQVLALANRSRAAEVVRVLSDVGMPVRVVEQHGATEADGMPRFRSTDPYDSAPRPGDTLARPTGVRVTIIEERMADREPFNGVCVEWMMGEHVGQAAAEALAQLLALGEGLPDPLPEPMARNGRLNEIMRDAIRSVLIFEGFVVRDDDDYRPAVWVVNGPGSERAASN